MAEADDKPVGRRKFLKKAAVGAAALVGQGQVVEGEEPAPAEHQHEHQTVTFGYCASRQGDRISVG